MDMWFTTQIHTLSTTNCGGLCVRFVWWRSVTSHIQGLNLCRCIAFNLQRSIAANLWSWMQYNLLDVWNIQSVEVHNVCLVEVYDLQHTRVESLLQNLQPLLQESGLC